MSLNDPIANALSNILNCEKEAKPSCMIKPVSKTIKRILDAMKDNLFIGDYSEIDDGKGKILKVNLIGRINKCGAIKPRFPVKKDDIEKSEKRYLIAKNFGIILISTSKGLMTHKEAKEKKLGGKLIAYCY